jgi:hypothetical protein
VIAPAGDFPRIAVGRSGNVYVTYSVVQTTKDASGAVIKTWLQVMLDKYSSCRSGLQQQWGYPRTVANNATPLACGAAMPGLDRCNDGNQLNSHTVTVSDFLNETVFVVYGDGLGNNNDRVIAAMAPNGGFNVTNYFQVSDNVQGRKFLPWACAEGRNLFVTWYDRRAATTAAPDLTDYFAGWVKLDTVGPRVQVNRNLTRSSDPQCNSGWPGGTRDAATATSCPTPQIAGRCLDSAGNTTGTCDFNVGCPTAGDTCSTNSGAPKYGDYNANACAAGRLFAGWASTVAPAGFTGAVPGLSVFTRTIETKWRPTAIP